MTKSRLMSTLGATGLLAGVLAAHLGCNAMSNEKLELKWEWPAGRTVAAKMLVRVESIDKVSSGLFGLGKSPSMDGYLPDARQVNASVISGPDGTAGRALTFNLPGPESARLKAGANAGLGLVAGQQVVVCVAAAPDGDAAAQASWLAQWTCAAN